MISYLNPIVKLLCHYMLQCHKQIPKLQNFFLN